MKRAYAFLVVGFLVACAGKPVDLIQEPFTNDQVQLKSRVDQIFSYAQNKKLKELESAHLYSSKFTKFDDWEPLTRQDATTAKKGENEAFSSISNFQYTITDFKADVFGSVAVTTFTIDYGMQVEKDKIKAKARATMVFVKDGKEWKITHEHFSPFKANP